MGYDVLYILFCHWVYSIINVFSLNNAVVTRFVVGFLIRSLFFHIDMHACC